MPENISNMPSDQIKHISLNAMQRFIRRTNIDEIPQLINIFYGEMSFVGPRPALFSQQELIEHRKLGGAFELKPGLGITVILFSCLIESWLLILKLFILSISSSKKSNLYGFSLE